MQFRKMLITYFAVYLLIFIMVLCTMIPLSKQIHMISREQVLEENYLHLQKGMTELENQLSKMTQMASLMCLDEDLLRLARMKQEEVAVSHSIYTLRVRKQISYYRCLLDNVEFCVIAFPNNRLFVSDLMISTDYLNMDTRLFKVGEMDVTEFVERMHSSKNMVCCIPGNYVTHDVNTYSEPMLTFITHGALNSGMCNVASFMFGVKSHVFLEKLMPDIFRDGGWAVLLNESGEALAALGIEADETLAAQLNQNTVMLENENYVIFSGKSSVQGLRLAIGVPESQITQSTQILMSFMYRYLTVSLLLFILLCGIYALWHYRSVKRVVNIGSRLSGKPYQKINGYQFVQDVLEEISTTKDKLAREYSMLDSAYLNTMLLNNCLYGVYVQEEINALKKYVGELPLYCLAVIKYSDSFDSARILQTELDVQKLLPDVQVIPIRQKPMKSILLITAQGEKMTLSKDVVGCLEKLLQNDECMAGVSDGLTGLEMMHQGYQQAQQTLREQKGEGKSAIVLYQPVESVSSLVEISHLKKLNDFIFSGNRDGVTAVFSELNERISLNAGIGEEQFWELYYSLQLVLQNIARELKTEIAYPACKNNMPYWELLAKLHQEALRIIDFIKAKQQWGSERLYHAILEKMEELMADPGLNAARIAAEMGYSEKHIFRIIKANSGKTFGEHLKKMRISRSEVLLRDTSFSNETIAQETGFASLSTFYRAFNEVHGVTPAVWRTAQEKKKELSSFQNMMQENPENKDDR